MPALEPPGGRPYPLALGEGRDPAKALIGLAAGLTGFVLLTPVVTRGVLRLLWPLLAPAVAEGEYLRSALAFERPEGLLAAHLGLAMLLVTALLVHRFWFARRIVWLWSVQPGLRWRYLLACGIAALVLLNGVYLASQGGLAGRWQAQPQALSFLLVVALTSPLQAVAEEVFFRGLVLSCLGLALSNRWFAIGLSALIFALFHGTQDLPLFVDRFSFGVLAGILVWRTGGLEAGIAAHVVNNLFAFFYAAFTSSIADLRAVKTLSWSGAAWDLAGFGLFALSAWWIGGRMRVAVTTPLSSQSV